MNYEKELFELQKRESQVVSDVMNICLQRGLSREETDRVVSALYTMMDIGHDKARL